MIETLHPVAAAAVDDDGSVIATIGDDPDRDFFVRSAIKPLQAAVSQRNGSDLGSEQLAIASASHGGLPVHVAYVAEMLGEFDLSTTDLMCPPARPTDGAADRLWAGRCRVAAESVFHNCSGKHAAMLRACVAKEWSLDYLAPDHPLQQEVVGEAEEAAGRKMRPVGVDGCGIPTLRSDVIGLATIFSVLVNEDRYAATAVAAARFGSLTSAGDRPEAQLARWLPAVVKGGAEGCIGLGMLEHGLGFAAKAWSGSPRAAVLGLIEVMTRVGVVPDYQRSRLVPFRGSVILGGGGPVGGYEVLEARPSG